MSRSASGPSRKSDNVRFRAAVGGTSGHQVRLLPAADFMSTHPRARCIFRSFYTNLRSQNGMARRPPLPHSSQASAYSLATRCLAVSPSQEQNGSHRVHWSSSFAIAQSSAEFLDTAEHEPRQRVVTMFDKGSVSTTSSIGLRTQTSMPDVGQQPSL